MSYRNFSNFEKLLNKARDTFRKMDGLLNEYISLYENPAGCPKTDRIQELLKLMDTFVDNQVVMIEEIFFNRKFNILGDYICGADIFYFAYQDQKIYYDTLSELYNQLNEIVEQEEEANEIL